MWDVGFRLWGPGCRLFGSGCRVQVSGFGTVETLATSLLTSQNFWGRYR